jgi:hypothetical protein
MGALIGAVVWVAIMLALVSGAKAQQVDPSDQVALEWQAAKTAQDHLAGAIRVLIEMRQREHAQAESELKYLRDNYVPKNAAKHD